MLQLTDSGRKVVEDVARRHGFSTQAVAEMLGAVSVGYGNQAQFNHPEFGGFGQWSSGGMVMIGDMFNNGLKSRVAGLCQELSGLIQGQPLFEAPAQSQTQSQGGAQQQSHGGVTGSSLFVAAGRSASWWPPELGSPGSTGAQNSLRYAYFPGQRRLAIDIGGAVTVYDTGDHQIGGFSQQQSGDQSLLFTSQYGLVRVADLPVIESSKTAATSTGGGDDQTAGGSKREATGPAQGAADPGRNTPQSQPSAPAPAPRSLGAQSLPADEIVSLIEKLADLHARGILTDAEFEGKKAELLGRL